MTILGNILILLFWLFFFKKINSVNGWKLEDIFVLQGMAALSFSLVYLFFGGVTELGTYIVEGTLDHFLLLPKPVLLTCLLSKIKFTALGDLVYASALLYFANISLLKIMFLVFLSFFGATIFVSFQIIVHSLGFFIGNTSQLAFQLTNSLVTFCLYPPSIFKGTTRIILYTILPAGLIVFLPLQLFMHFNFLGMLKLTFITGMFLTMAITFFTFGLRRYESGNYPSVSL